MATVPKQLLKQIAKDVSTWSNLARDITADRDRIQGEADRAEFVFRYLILDVDDRGIQWRLLPLHQKFVDPLRALERHFALPKIPQIDAEALVVLSNEATFASRAVAASHGLRRMFSTRSTKDSADAAASFLIEYHDSAVRLGLPDRLHKLDHRARPDTPIALADALDESMGLIQRIATKETARLWPAESVAGLAKSVKELLAAAQAEDQFRAAAIKAGEFVRAAETDRQVREMPLERLREATGGRLRIGALLEAGISNVSDVIANRARLTTLPGVGPTTARNMAGAAMTLRQATYDEMPIRLDLSRKADEASSLLRALTAWGDAREFAASGKFADRVRAMSRAAQAITPEVTHVIVISGTASHADLKSFVAEAEQRAGAVRRSASESFDPWDEFSLRPTEYYRMLQELGFNAEDEQKTHGDLPEDVVEAIRSFELDTQRLTDSLRGYQHFGARFALVQKKVLIGDEMGLGKTFEALAAVAHLASKGSRHSLVVCPAAVVTNWMREVQSKTDLPALRLHGVDRANGLRSWVRGGGVAVTTYETLAWLDRQPHDVELACVIFDEAHYIKNPWSQRALRSRALIGKTERAVLLTGTPLENKVEEFRNLIGYLRPDLVRDVDELRPRRFKQQVAPAYLRRNQEDVLSELPDLVEVDEWLEMSDSDEAAYREAVRSKNFQEMRQSAMLQGEKSAKVQRLVEIVEEAEENGRKVLVFSHYRNVLDQVCQVLSGDVIGPLTGAVPAAKRQDMVDQFTQAREGAVLVAQIQAGGVGLNIQAASVVVICEPQLKPTIEWQAIARAHRMGQPQSVQVHRLLTDPGVDLRVTQILARKKELFDEFARASDTAESAPEAFDVSEAELVREVVSAERRRLFPVDAAEGD